MSTGTTSDTWTEDLRALVEADATEQRATGPQPCAARPHAGRVHTDGPCRCFVGGPAPEHAETHAA